MTILIAYDGSANADHAITIAGTLFPGAVAEVLHVWEPVANVAARAAMYIPMYEPGTDAVEFEREQALAVAQRGVDLAVAAGLEASGEAIGATGPLWKTIVDRIAEIEPDVTIMGTRGLTGVRSAFAGSVSHAVIVHADRPVLTVPLEDHGSH